MTVGIAARCNTSSEEEKVVVAADRMITMGLGSEIEYEHTNSKIFTLKESSNLSVVGIGAGDTGPVEQILSEVKKEIQNREKFSVKKVGEIASEKFREMRRSKIEEEVLSSYDLTFEEYLNNQKNLHTSFIEDIESEIRNKRNQVDKRVEILICGVDSMGAHIFSIEEGSLSEWNRQSFFAIGSGEQAALLPFLRNGYDDNSEVETTLISVVEAKDRAEEARGVGTEFDLAVISQGHIYEMDEEKFQIKDRVEEITTAQEAERNDLINSWKYEFNSGGEDDE